MKKTQLGFHEQEERNRAYRRAKQTYEWALKIPIDSPMRAYYAGYLEAIADMAWDHGQEELANLVMDLWGVVEGGRIVHVAPGLERTRRRVDY